MRLLVLLSAPLAVHAFIFPEDRPDGVYTVAIDRRGNALAEPVFVASLPDSPKLLRRQNRAPALPSPQTNCHQRSFDANDYASALAVFNQICDRAEIYAANTSFVVQSGSAVVYLCNYNASNRCWSSESDEADKLMDSKCGSNGIGWVYIPQYQKSYGRDNKGIDIC